jgi:hypothetical protein
MDDHDRELIERAGQVPGGHEWLSRRAFAELIVGLKEAVKAELLAANELTGKIHRLNQSLLWFTIVLGLLTAFQFGAWLRDVTR